MSNSIQLENLSLSELNILLGHLRLGEGYLKERLNANQFQNLLKLGTLNLTQKDRLSCNKAEKLGHISLLLNTIITSVFGAWMGYSGFVGLRLNSLSVFFGITCLAVLISLIAGYFRSKLTTQSAQAAITDQKLHNIQLSVLKLLIDKQNDKLESLTKYLNYALNYIQSKSFLITMSLPTDVSSNAVKFDLLEFKALQRWQKALHDAVNIKINFYNRNKVYDFYQERLKKIIDEIDNTINLYSYDLPDNEKNKLNVQEDRGNFLQLLSMPYKNITRLTTPKSWLKQNILTLIAGIVPTILGCFASMFVFLSGGPNLAKDLGFLTVESMLRNPNYRVIELSISIILTAYYAASFVYNNYKAYIRQHELEKTKMKLADYEKESIRLQKKHNLLYKLKRQITRIIDIYLAIENIDIFDNKTQKSSLSRYKTLIN